ncbi:hypothetical protein Nepgr_002385 [Nepenthes gracilis]|uniref:Protein DA1-like domain-containing protein n=1 Tax=Nepenthes gracilis TaxID=150966 RepID=A0AAD3RY87_NEPGR|nr:hypothetical protein Nepgr_002385 [Nepenthes gracilis]
MNANRFSLDIREFNEGLHMKIDQQIPLLLVEREALNEAMDGENNSHHHLPETRGLCLSEDQTVSTILRPKIGVGNQIIDLITEPYRLIRRCEVTARLILFGLLIGSSLAHVMMNAWRHLTGYPNLSPEIKSNGLVAYGDGFRRGTEAARQGIVPLQIKAGALLLFAAAIKSLVVIGPNACVTETLIHNYEVTPDEHTTPLQGLLAWTSTHYQRDCLNVACTIDPGR